MGLELDTVYRGAKIHQWLDRLDNVAKNQLAIKEFIHFPEEVPEPEGVRVTLEEVEGDGGHFVVNIYAEGFSDEGFNSFQFDADFPEGVQFVSGECDLPNFYFFARPTDALCGAYAGEIYKPEGRCLLASLTFTGPFPAAFLVDLKRVKISAWTTRHTILETDRVHPGD